MDQHELWSSSQAAAYLRTTRQAVQALARSGEVGRRVGRAWAFTRAELDAWRDRPCTYGEARPKASAGPAGRAGAAGQTLQPEARPLATQRAQAIPVRLEVDQE